MLGRALACPDCHVPRAGLVLAADALSGAGEAHDHGLDPWTPSDVLDLFDTAGTDTLPIEQVPVTACLHCHLRLAQEADDAGTACSCPTGDPTLRATWDAQVGVLQSWAGATYQVWKKDPGAWAHNFDYMAQIMFDTLEDLGGDPVTAGWVRPTP